MPPRLPRTIEVVDWKVAEILRQKTPAERLALIDDCNRAARTMLAAGIRYRHSDWSEDQVLAEVKRRWLDGSNGTDGVRS
jgi:hypothetical protein